MVIRKPEWYFKYILQQDFYSQSVTHSLGQSVTHSVGQSLTHTRRYPLIYLLNHLRIHTITSSPTIFYEL